MKKLSDYISESILSSTNSGKASIEEKLRQYGLDPAKVTYNSDGSIDYVGDVNFSHNKLSNGKLPFKFHNVTGNFNCAECGLTTLEGSPEIIKHSFDCSNNKLKSLIGGPSKVGDIKYDYTNSKYICSNNQLTTLKGAPKTVYVEVYM